jgi:hypothetical protein
MNTMTIASEESAFRTGLKEAGFVSSDFMVKYESPAASRRRRLRSRRCRPGCSA